MAPPITVKPLRAEEWRELRDVRLRALRDSPQAFLTTAVQAENEPDEFWANRAALAARGERWGIFLALTDKGEAIGMVSGVEDSETLGVVELVQMWIDPAWRNQSVGAQLVAAIIEWSSPRADRIRLGVADDNQPAIALYTRCGFLPTGEEEPFEGRPGIASRYYERRLR
jgi:RimJ/RimL family protein N-acetyltransferase